MDIEKERVSGWDAAGVQSHELAADSIADRSQAHANSVEVTREHLGLPKTPGTTKERQKMRIATLMKPTAGLTARPGGREVASGDTPLARS